MIDKDTIEMLSRASTIIAAGEAIDAASDGLASTIALPESYRLHDLEAQRANRRRARGQMATSALADFAAYTEAHAEAGAAVFVEQANMRARAVLNLGEPGAPGHADNNAELALLSTAEYRAMLELLGQSRGAGLTQRDLAEYMEDWAPLLTCTHGDEVLPTQRAIDAVRRITIDSARKSETVATQMGAERSEFEKVAATSAGNPLPGVITATLSAYEGLAVRAFSMRLGVRTGSADKPALTLTLRLVKAEQHAEAMAQEFAQLVRGAISELPVHVGSYTARP